MVNDHDGDPFARVLEELTGGVQSPAKVGREMGEQITPVPADAPPPPLDHRDHGRASTAWEYLDAAGSLLGRVARFDKPDGSKVVLPQTLRRVGERHKWAWKGFDEPRPLYGLTELAARPAMPVIVVEGEKTADAARAIFADAVAITWPGGSKAPGKVDWSPLAGRDVVVFPDADEPGRKAAADVARRITAAGALTVAVVDLPGFLPTGWDLADPWPEGFDRVRAEAAILVARDRAQPGGVEWPWGYRMDDQGLSYDAPTQGGGVVPLRLSAPFDVLAEARDPDGGGWAVVLRFRDRDGREKTHPVLRAKLASGGAEVRAELADQGLIVSPARGKADKFAIALAEVRCARRLTLVAATGWCAGRFVLPGEVIGDGGEPVLFTGDASALHYGKSGRLDVWKCEVAAKAEGNRLLTFALSLAFLGPLLRPLDIEGGGVHFRGSSSCGKTTLAYAAGSVWGGGGPLGFGQTWRATANALEMVAHGQNDVLAVFDELALVAPDEAGAAAYSLASGQSKARSRSDGSLRRRPEWRIAILSTGETGLADHIGASKRGERPMAGQELRLLDIAADAGAKMGVWEVLHGAPGPAELSDMIRAACGRDFGHAGPAFLEQFIARRTGALAFAKEHLVGFLKRALREGDSGQAQRAALRFGAVAVAGELAARFRVVPWPPGQADAAALRLYQQWAAAFGRDAPREDREVLRRLKGVIESERAAFAPLGDADTTDAAGPSVGGRDGEARGLKTHGFRHVRGAEVRYLFHDGGWADVFKGFNLADAARTVDAAGFLEKDGDGRHLKKRVKIRGELHRLYCVRSEILGADLGD